MLGPAIDEITRLYEERRRALIAAMDFDHDTEADHLGEICESLDLALDLLKKHE